MSTFRLTLFNPKWLPHVGDKLELVISYEVVDTKFLGKINDEVENTHRGKIIVGISGTLQSMWGLGGINLEKALVEFAKKHIRDKLSVNALSDEEELQLNSSNSPKQFPYDVIGKDYHKTFAYEISVSEPEMTPTVITKNDQEYQWDIFISYASEDKETVATPLGDILKKKGLIVWLDQYQITVGDSLQAKLDEGLSKSRFGVVIIGEHFFSKVWTQKELNALFSKEEGQEKVVLPVWHDVDYQYVANYSPLLASKVAATTSNGLEEVAKRIFEAVSPYLEASGKSKIRLTHSEIKYLRDQIKWKRHHEGSFLNLDPLLSILEKLALLEEGEFEEGELNITELKLLLKITEENKKYANGYDYGPLPLADSNRLRQETLNPILAIIDKLRYIIQVKENTK